MADKPIFFDAWREIVTDDVVCPYCRGQLYSLVVSTGVLIGCGGKCDTYRVTKGKDIADAYYLLTYQFEMRNIPAITPPDTTDWLDR